MRKFPALLCLALFAGSPAWAQDENPVVEALDFEGLKRVEAPALRAVMTTKVGKPLSERAVSEDIRAIYAMGFFRDVRVYQSGRPSGGVTLTYVLKEKPAVRRVAYEGQDEVSEDDLKEVVDIRPFTILSEAKIKKNLQKIKELYAEKGFYLAEVDYRLEPATTARGTPIESEVVVVFVMNENAKVEVRKIRFVGNNNVPDDELKSGLITKEGDLIAFVTGAGTYRKDAFQVDMLRLTSVYFDRGYINVKVDTPDAEISADRKYIYITIRIEEGEQYNVGKLAFSGDELEDQPKPKELVETKENEVFNRSKLGQDLLRLKTQFEDDGYAYANITPLTQINQDDRIIDLTFDAQKGQKVYYERINILGNTKTRDKVIRRELRIYEGELTSASKRELSKRRVTALGYFERVDVRTRRGSSDDKQIVDIEIKEKATGTFQIGAGFSSTENFIATAQIAQDNFLGRGWNVALSAQISSLRQLFSFSFTEPYFLDTRTTLRLNAFNTENNFRAFSRSSSGGSVTLGHPLTDNLQLAGTYSIEFVRSRSDGQRDQPWFAALNNRGRISSLQAFISYDTRDNRLFPSNGQFHLVSAELSHPVFGASENRSFQRYRAIARFYKRLVWKFVGKASFRLGMLQSMSDAGLSPAEKFIMGGINTIRGYQLFSIGPERRAALNDRGTNLGDPNSTTFVFVEGGNKQFLANFELEFPIFEAVGIRGVLFMDAGNAFAEDENLFYAGGKARKPQRFNSAFDPTSLPLGLFWSVGFGFRWFSPIGPLRFEWGIPLTRRPTDSKGPLFEFSIGNSF